ncbi:MAG TPA: NAD-dependent epimerase/dehydratase family protein [Dehalococcoidia bacterium]|nr:NAD-dependent epimerase/dehydratase family protein [Dehalococcoidia bacterium]
MRVLVTGGAGFIGSHLVDALVAQGDDVVVLDNFKRGRHEHIDDHVRSGGVRLITGDIRDEETVAGAMDGAELVYHLAAQSNVMGAVEDMDYSFSTNVVGTYIVLKCAAAAGVRRVVFSSSREVYGDPNEIPVREDAPLVAKNPYGASKLAGEAYCRVWQETTGLDCIVLRFANVYGPRDRDRVIPRWLTRASEGDALEVYGGHQVIDFVWVGQAVRALLAAATCVNGGPVNVGSGAGTPIIDLGERILALTNARSELRVLPPRSIEVVRFVADVSRMRSVLGIEPEGDPLAQLPQTKRAVAPAP